MDKRMKRLVSMAVSIQRNPPMGLCCFLFVFQPSYKRCPQKDPHMSFHPQHAVVTCAIRGLFGGESRDRPKQSELFTAKIIPQNRICRALVLMTESFDHCSELL